MLSLFLLRRDVSQDREPEYDTTHGFIVAAESHTQARDFAACWREVVRNDGRIRDEASTVWYALTTTCRYIGFASPSVAPGVILEDHQAG